MLHISIRGVIKFLLVEGLASVFMAADRSLELISQYLPFA